MTNAAASEAFTLVTSRHFPEWLASSCASIAITTYQAGKLLLLGVKADGNLSVFERSFQRCMGLGVSEDGRSLALATHYQVQRFDNVLEPGQVAEQEYDALYAPHGAWVTGDLDIHDVAFGSDGRPVFVNTLFGCIATVSDGHSFKPLWKPPFISRLAPEDRCHLNGMAMEAGVPRFVTAVSRSDVADGWRDHRRDGGLIIDIGSGEIIASGLSMPHSPRLHDRRLWVLNSGRGDLGNVDPATGKFEPIGLCPGYARGLTFLGNHAIVGLSTARHNRTFSGLDLDDRLASAGATARCGLAIFDTLTGNMAHWVRIEGVVRELYDVAILPGVRCPSAIGFKTDEVKHVISVEPLSVQLH